MRSRGPVYACPYCGSRNLDRNMLVGGPMATVDNYDNTYTCLDCRKSAVPLEFYSIEEWIFFKQSLNRTAENGRDAGRDFVQVPIVPVDTRALVSIGGIDMPLGKVAEVVSVEWADGTIRRGDYSAKFARYWQAISGSRYNTTDIFMMDLAGMLDGRPNFWALRELVKKKYGVWLDLGIRSDQDLFDAFSVEIFRAVADTSFATSMKHFEDLYELSDRCIPCIHLHGKVVWGRRLPGLENVGEVVDHLQRIGFEEVAVIDLSRLGTRQGISPDMMKELEGEDIRLMVGGGAVESDIEAISKSGFHGAFIDPFTPVIVDIIGSDEAEKAPTTVPSTLPAKSRKPNYLATD